MEAIGALAFETFFLLYSSTTYYFAINISLLPFLFPASSDGAVRYQPQPRHNGAKLWLFKMKPELKVLSRGAQLIE